MNIVIFTYFGYLGFSWQPLEGPSGGPYPPFLHFHTRLIPIFYINPFINYKENKLNNSKFLL